MTHCGKTTFLFRNYDSNVNLNLSYNLLLDEVGAIHWVTFSDMDLSLNSSFHKIVLPGNLSNYALKYIPFGKLASLPVNRTTDGIEFQDDFIRFVLNILYSVSFFGVEFYMKNAFSESIVSFHRWDFKMFVSTLSRKRSNMSECDFFKLSFVEEGKDVNDTLKIQYMSLFHAERMRSLINGRKYTGETYYEAEDPPRSQRIHISDSSQSDSEFRIDFTNDELNSTSTFCRAITEIISRKWQNSSNRSFYLSVFLYSMFVYFRILRFRSWRCQWYRSASIEVIGRLICLKVHKVYNVHSMHATHL